MNCIYCNTNKTTVTNSGDSSNRMGKGVAENVKRVNGKCRFRKCLNCGETFTTLETPFDKDILRDYSKIEKGLRRMFGDDIVEYIERLEDWKLQSEKLFGGLK